MNKNYLQRLLSDEKHLKHVAMEMAASHLAGSTYRVVEAGQDTGPLDEGQEPEYEEYEEFYDPLVKAVEQFAGEVQAQASALQKTCICFCPDDERVSSTLIDLLRPLPLSYSFKREDEKCYRIEIGGVIFSGLADEVIEATRGYVSACAIDLDLPTNTTDELH